MEQPFVSRQDAGRDVGLDGDVPGGGRQCGLACGVPDQRIHGDLCGALRSLQIGQLQQAFHQGGEAVDLALHDLEKVPRGFRTKVPLFLEQPDPRLQDRQRGTELMGRVVGEILLHHKDLIQPPGHLVERAGQLSRLVPAVRDDQGPAQILRCAPADLAGQLVQRVQRLSHQPVDEKQAGGQDCGHGQQTLEMENPSGLTDGLAGLQFHHGQTGSCACRRILGREDGHGLHGVGHLDGRQIIGQGQQEAAEREQDCAEQGEPQA